MYAAAVKTVKVANCLCALDLQRVGQQVLVQTDQALVLAFGNGVARIRGRHERAAPDDAGDLPLSVGHRHQANEGPRMQQPTNVGQACHLEAEGALRQQTKCALQQ